jgi:hypothetical protein
MASSAVDHARRPAWYSVAAILVLMLRLTFHLVLRQLMASPPTCFSCSGRWPHHAQPRAARIARLIALAGGRAALMDTSRTAHVFAPTRSGVPDAPRRPKLSPLPAGANIGSAVICTAEGTSCIIAGRNRIEMRQRDGNRPVHPGGVRHQVRVLPDSADATHRACVVPYVGVRRSRPKLMTASAGRLPCGS